MKRIYRFAGRVTEIDSLYDKVHEYCRGWLADRVTSDAVEIRVRSTPEDLELEGSRSDLPYIPSDEYLEELAVYRQICEQMPFFDTILFHGSAIAVDGEAYLFTAPSGVGKSTHARLWRTLLGDRATMVNDDKPLIHMSENGPIVYGTPWNGKHHLSTNMASPLKAIGFICRDEVNRICPLTGAYPKLLQQVYRPFKPAALSKTVHLIDLMSQAVDFYEIHCNMDPEAARISFEGMSGKRLLMNLKQLTDRTVVVVTHRQAALQLCDQVVHI